MAVKTPRLQKRYPYLAELPAGIPINTGHFGKLVYDQSTEPNWHFINDWDLLFVTKGCAVIGLKNGVFLKVPQNHFLLLPPFTPFLRDVPEAPVEFCFFHFSFCPIPDSVFPSVRSDCLELGRPVRIPWIFSRKDVPEAWEIYRRQLQNGFLRPGAAWEMASLTSGLLSALGRFALKLDLPADEPLFNPNEGVDPRVIELFQRVAKDPLFPWKVSDLADSVGVSTEHLDRLCHRYMGAMTLKKFIVESRMIRVGRIVSAWNKKPLQSVKEISTACGFTSPQFFCRQFKQFHGMSPLAYRQRAIGT